MEFAPALIEMAHACVRNVVEPSSPDLKIGLSFQMSAYAAGASLQATRSPQDITPLIELIETTHLAPPDKVSYLYMLSMLVSRFDRKQADRVTKAVLPRIKELSKSGDWYGNYIEPAHAASALLCALASVISDTLRSEVITFLTKAHKDFRDNCEGRQAVCHALSSMLLSSPSHVSVELINMMLSTCYHPYTGDLGLNLLDKLSLLTKNLGVKVKLCILNHPKYP